jgi:DNA-directed RNA polymerase specialized sigma24 family protein
MTPKDTAILEHLPLEEREVLILSSFYGLARDEIAGVMGASADMVDALRRRAVEHLRYVLTSGRSQVAAA